MFSPFRANHLILFLRTPQGEGARRGGKKANSNGVTKLGAPRAGDGGTNTTHSLQRTIARLYGVIRAIGVASDHCGRSTGVVTGAVLALLRALVLALQA